MRRNAAWIAALLTAAAPCFLAPLSAQVSAPPPPPLEPEPVVTPAEQQEAQAPVPPAPPPPTLEDLIPDAAVANPEAWAQQGLPADAAPPPGQLAEPDLDASAPLAEAPLITVPWPEAMELPDVAELQPEEDIQFANFDDVIPQLPPGTDERISKELVLSFPTDQALFPYTKEFITRFKSLSSIETMSDDGNVARLAAQAREDETLLNRMLRIYGFYDAQVIRSVSGIQPGEQTAAQEGGDTPGVRFDIIPGPQYKVGAVDLGMLAATGPDFDALRKSYAVFPGDPLLMDKVQDERFNLDKALGESGYPFAAIMDPSILVDHARTEGDVTMPVTPGGKYNFGTVNSNLPEFLSGRHLAQIARFEPGDLYMRSDELDLRQAILTTGLVGTVSVTPREVVAPMGDQPGTVDLDVKMTKAPLRTLAGAIGYGTEEGVRLEGSWENRNLFPPEGMLRVRGILGTQEQLAGVTFRKNNFTGRDKILTLDAYASTLDYDAYDARTVSVVGTFEKISTLIFQKPFSWSVGLQLTATGEREADANGNLGPRQTYFIAALPLYAQIDTSDNLLNPTRGFRLAGRLAPTSSRTNGQQSFYFHSEVDARYYQSVGEKLVVAARTRVASISGASLSAVAPSQRLYAGGGGSVRGYGYQQIGPQNDLGDPTGGLSLIELSLEARIRTGLLGGALGIVPFVDAGTVGASSTPGFNEIKLGAGIGARYYSSFGPLRIDFAVPLNKGPNDSSFAVYVALGQAF